LTQDRRVAVIGLGYVGLPLAIAFAESGLEVEGIDASPGRIAELLARRSPIDDVTDERLGSALDGRLRVVAPVDARLPEADAIFVCVPTPITATKDPDLAPVLSAAELICGAVRRGQLVVLQSTTFPGTTTGPFAEVVERSGLKAGVDFDLAFAPERVNPGDPASASKGVPRLVGATTPEATRRAADLLRNINDQVLELSSPDAAELAKLLENVFRNINIAFVNEIAQIFNKMGISVHDVLDAARTKWNFLPFVPGLVGGHCIGVDPYYLAYRAQQFGHNPEVILAGRRTNDGMGDYIAARIDEALGKPSSVLVLGLTFKENIPDLRNSKVVDIIAGLKGRGHDVTVHDAFADHEEAAVECGLLLAGPLEKLRGYDAVVGAVMHAPYAAFGAADFARLVRPGGLVADVKGMWRRAALPAGLRRWSI